MGQPRNVLNPCGRFKGRGVSAVRRLGYFILSYFFPVGVAYFHYVPYFVASSLPSLAGGRGPWRRLGYQPPPRGPA